MLVNSKVILENCLKKGTAVGAFNINNLETAQAVIAAGVARKTSLIVQLTRKTLDYAGEREIFNLVKNIIEEKSGKIPMSIHLDHGKDFAICKRMIELGILSVMIDGSGLSYLENKTLTKRVVDYAHQKGVTVQGELGTVPYLTHRVSNELSLWDQYMTDPKQALDFVRATGMDTLAVAIGNAHGFQKEREVPDWKRLSEIRKLVDIPLILHGASDWSESKIKEAIKRGVSCFNVDTDIRVAFMESLRSYFKEDRPMEDPRVVMDLAKKAVQAKVEEKLKMLHS
jgi:ketose-bisphosphate aldolase